MRKGIALFLLCLILIPVTVSFSGREKKSLYLVNEPRIKISVFGLFKPAKLEVVSLERRILVFLPEPDNVPMSHELLAGTTVTYTMEGAPEGAFYVSFSDTRILAGKVIVDHFGKLSIPGKIEREFPGWTSLTVTAKDGHLVPVIETGITSASLVAAYSELKRPDLQEAIKAQAVVIRSFYMSHKDRHPEDKAFQFCDTSHCTLMQGMDAFGDRKITQDDLLTITSYLVDRKGQPVPGFSSSVCGGYTLLPGTVWNDTRYKGVYAQVKCEYCKSHERYRWSTEMSDDELRQVAEVLAKRDIQGGHFGMDVVEKDDLTGYVRRIKLDGPGYHKSFSGNRLRMAAGRVLGWNRLFSSKFTVSRKKDGYVFEGKGMGHGVGFCQSGAIEMARVGKNFKEIVHYYFPLAEIIDEPYEKSGIVY